MSHHLLSNLLTPDLSIGIHIEIQATDYSEITKEAGACIRRMEIAGN